MVWPGKSDLYHAFQATLIPYNREDLSIACAIKEKKMEDRNEESRCRCIGRAID